MASTISAATELPLEGNAKRDVLKVYMRNTGLLMEMLKDGSQADIFSKSGKKLYFYSKLKNYTLLTDEIKMIL